MNNTRTLVVVLIFTAATLVVGTAGSLTTTTQSAFAYTKDNGKGNGNGNTITIHATTTAAVAAQAPPRTCEECFTTILNQKQLMNVLGSDRSVEQFCETLRSLSFSETEFRQGLIEDNVTPPQADELIACLKAVGIVFRP
jgi:hypothetical protein